MNRLASRLFRCGAAILAASCIGVAALGAGAVIPASSAQAQDVGDLDRAVAALRGISTLQARFVQTDRNGKQVSGTLTLKRPGRIRFQYQPGVPILIVGDGAALTFVDYQTRQVQRWPIRNSPLGALLDPTRDVKKYGRLLGSGNANQILVEVRDKAHPEYGVITLRFSRKGSAPGGLELAGWVALDSQNKQTAIALSNHRYGMAVGDSTFRFNDPRGSGRR